MTAGITIRNLHVEAIERLRVQVAHIGRTLDVQVRRILEDAAGRASPTKSLASAIRSWIAPLGGADLERLPREPAPRAAIL